MMYTLLTTTSSVHESGGGGKGRASECVCARTRMAHVSTCSHTRKNAAGRYNSGVNKGVPGGRARLRARAAAGWVRWLRRSEQVVSARPGCRPVYE